MGEALPQPAKQADSEPLETLPNIDDIVIVQDEPDPPENPEPYIPPPDLIVVKLDPLSGDAVSLPTGPFEATGFKVGDSVYAPSGTLPAEFLPAGERPNYEAMPDWLAVSSGDVVVGYSVNSLRFDVPDEIENFVYDSNGFVIGTIGPSGVQLNEDAS